MPECTFSEEDGSHKENKTVTLTSTEIDFPESEPQETGKKYSYGCG